MSNRFLGHLTTSDEGPPSALEALLLSSPWTGLKRLGAEIDERGVRPSLGILRRWLHSAGRDAPLLKVWAKPQRSDSDALSALKRRVRVDLIVSKNGEIMTVQKASVLNARDTIQKHISRGLYCYADLVRNELLTEEQAVREIVKHLERQRKNGILKAWNVVRWANHVLYGHPESWAHLRGSEEQHPQRPEDRKSHGHRQEVFEAFARGIRSKMTLTLQQELENRARFIVQKFDEARGVGALTALVTRGVYQTDHVVKLTINWTQNDQGLRERIFENADFQLRIPKLRKNEIRHGVLLAIRGALHPFVAPQLGPEIPPLGDPKPFKNWGSGGRRNRTKDLKQAELF